MSRARPTVMCAAGDEAELARLCEALQTMADGDYDIEAHHSGASLAEALHVKLARGERVPLIIVDQLLADGSGAETLSGLAACGCSGRARKILVTGAPESAEVGSAAGTAHDGIIPKPWSRDDLAAIVDRHLAASPAEPPAGQAVHDTVSEAGHAPLLIRHSDELIRGLRYSILADRGLSDDEVEQAMIAEIERVLEGPKAVSLPAGTRIATEGEDLNGITVLLEGRVRMFREVEGRQIVFHHRTAGRIIGLMALVRALPASFTVEAETDVLLLPLTLEQLDLALGRSATLAVHFASALVRSLARRNLRSIEQQLEIREAASTKLQEAERLAVVGQLAADVAHELNNPLQGIVAYSHLLLERIAEDDPSRDSILKITAEADRCRNIVRALLDFSRPNKPQTRPTDLNTLLEQSLDLLAGQALFLNIEIESDLEPGLPSVLVDPGQIQQVLINLIVNAAEAMDGDGRLALRTRTDQLGNAVEVEVSDTGPGIAEADLDRIFDPFFSTKEATHGTGLGLAISYGIVREHHGTISVRSEPGIGTTFVVRVPNTAEWPLGNGLDEE